MNLKIQERPAPETLVQRNILPEVPYASASPAPVLRQARSQSEYRLSPQAPALAAGEPSAASARAPFSAAAAAAPSAAVSSPFSAAAAAAPSAAVSSPSLVPSTNVSRDLNHIYAVTRYPFTQPEDGFLRFPANVTVEITKQESSGWCWALYNNAAGWCPLSYLQILSAPPTSQPSAMPSTPSSPAHYESRQPSSLSHTASAVASAPSAPPIHEFDEDSPIERQAAVNPAYASNHAPCVPEAPAVVSAEHEALVLQLQELSLEVTTLRSTVTTLRTELEESNAANAVAHSEIEHLQAEVTRLRHQVEDANYTAAVKHSEADEVRRVLERQCETYAQEKERLGRDRECKLCMDTSVNAVLLPCAHLCVCLDCGQTLMSSGSKKCPICRKVIQTIRPAYFA